MRISKEALDLINTLQTRLELAEALTFTETWIRTLIKSNSKNGPLTTFAALEVIRKATGWSDQQILIREEKAVLVEQK